MSNLVLYSYWRSSCSYRVRIALNLKGVDHEIRPVHLVRDGGEQHKAEYKSLNPMGEVPCLVHEGRPVAQSMAILHYLERVCPQPALFPSDPYEASVVTQLCEMVNTGIQPIQNLKVLREVVKRFDADDAAKIAWAHDWIARGFEALETAVAKTAGVFCFGDQVTAADLFLVPQVYNANRFKVDMDRFPTLKRIEAHCRTLAAFEQADPANQIDAV